MVGIGKEKPKLQAKPVKIVRYEIQDVKTEDPKMRGKQKIVLFCEHPDSKEYVQISKAKFEKLGKFVSEGLWYSLDEEGSLQFGSAIAHVLRALGLSQLEDLNNLTIGTTTDPNGFLMVKGY